MWGSPSEPIDMPFGVLSGVPDVITHAKFYANRLRGFSAVAPRKVPFPIIIRTTLTTVLLYCDNWSVKSLASIWQQFVCNFIVFQNWKLTFAAWQFTRHQVKLSQYWLNGGAENAGVENAAPDGRGGKRGSGKVWKAKSPRYVTLLQVCYNSH